ncbi:MAG: hypothetical protein ABEJ92_11020 [Halobacteriales archaeon]
MGAGVELPAAVCRQYVALSRFNSPYPAHDRGHAVDLYPDAGAPSPVAGEVVAHHRVRAPSRGHAEPHDHLLVVDTGEHLARLLHVEPSVGDGDVVAVGDDLGRTVRSGYFAPWVDDHLHLGFRPPDADPVRATGSLPLELGIPVEPVAWDGTGSVVETGETSAVLDAPGHPAPGERFAGIATDGGDSDAGPTGPALDGGLPHYDGAGLFGRGAGPVSLLGTEVGVAEDSRVRWHDVEVRANGTPVHGLSLGAFREGLRAKLVSWDGPPAEVGERVVVTISCR